MPTPATILISILLVAVVALILRHQWKARKKGGSSCGCDCGHCSGGGH